MPAGDNLVNKIKDTKLAIRGLGPARVIPVQKGSRTPDWARFEVRIVLFTNTGARSKHMRWFSTEQEAEKYARELMFGCPEEEEEEDEE